MAQAKEVRVVRLENLQGTVAGRPVRASVIEAPPPAPQLGPGGGSSVSPESTVVQDVELPVATYEMG